MKGMNILMARPNNRPQQMGDASDDHTPPFKVEALDAVRGSDERRWLVDQLYVLYYEYRRVFGPTSATTRSVDDFTGDELLADGLAEQEQPGTDTVGLLLPQWEGWYYSPERLGPEPVPASNRVRFMTDVISPFHTEWSNMTSWERSHLLADFPPEVRQRIGLGLEELDRRILHETMCQRVRRYTADILRAGIAQARKDVKDAEHRYRQAERLIPDEYAALSGLTINYDLIGGRNVLVSSARDLAYRIRLLRLRLDWLLRWQKEDAKYQKLFRRNRITHGELVVSPEAVAEAKSLIIGSSKATLPPTAKTPREHLQTLAQDDRADREAADIEKAVAPTALLLLGEWYKNALILCGLLPDDLRRIEKRNGWDDERVLRSIVAKLPPEMRRKLPPELPPELRLELLSVITHSLSPCWGVRDQFWAEIANGKARRG